MAAPSSSSPSRPAAAAREPEAVGGMVPTLNGTGYMTLAPGPFSASWARHCASLPPSGLALDIGAAYGVAVERALSLSPVCSVIANDTAEGHLEALRAKMRDRFGARASERLSVLCAAFPDDDAAFAPLEGRVDALNCCRVLHLFDGPTLRRAVRRMFRTLRPGGRAFVLADTPRMGHLRESFLPEYLDHVREGREWPGLIEDYAAVDRSGRAKPTVPRLVHFLDERVLRREFEAAGFRVLRCESVDRRGVYPPFQLLDGRESVGIEAERPPL